MITGMGWEEMNVGSFPFPNQNRMMRNASSLSRESSEFEFVSRSFADNYSDEEGPVSPKLLNFCGNWDGWAEPFMISRISGTTTASVDHESDIIVNGEQHGDYNSVRALSEDTSTPNHGKDQRIKDNQNQNVLHSERRNNIEEGHIHEIKVRTSLGSLLDRRDFEHLPALTAYSKQMSHKQPAAIHDSPAWSWTTSTSSSSSSSSTVSPSSTPGDCNNRPSSYISKDEMGQYANYFNYQGSGEADADCSLSNQKKPIRSKWPAVMKLDFLRKTVPLRSKEEHDAAAKLRFIRNQETNQPLDYASYVAPRRVSFQSSRESTCSSINNYCSSTSTANSPVHLHGYGRDDQAIRGYKSAPVSPPQYIVKGSPYSPADAAAARGSARGHSSGNEYPCNNERTIVLRRRSADYLGTAMASSPITDQAAMASSPISDTSSNDPERRRAKVQARSPHHKTSMAGHYVEKQRGRAEEVKRRTPLPYRQSSLFGASCFFPAHNSHHHQLRHTR